MGEAEAELCAGPSIRSTGPWSPTGPWLRAILTVACLSVAIRILVPGLLLPLPLVGDEAQYWDWSRTPGWSYHTKGPLVAWLIALSTSVFGDSEFGVRLPAYLCAGLSTLFCGVAGGLLSKGDRRVALWSAVGFECVLGCQVSGLVMTIDAPMLACWMGAFAVMLGIIRALEAGCGNTGWGAMGRGATGWRATGLGIVFGLATALGFLAKFTVALGALGMLSVLWFATTRTGIERRAARRVALVAASVSLLGAVPILLWNAEHDWATFRHLVGHLDLGSTQPDKAWSPLWTLGLLGMAFGIAGPFTSLVLGAGVLRWWRRPDPAIRVCLAASVPVFVFYLAVSFFTETEGNWILGGYGPLVPLGAEWLLRGCSRHRHWVRCALQVRFAVTTLLILAAPLLAGLVPPLGRAVGVDWQSPLRRLQTNRSFARDVEALVRTELLVDPSTVTLVANYYDKTALLSFYGTGQPRVRCASWVLGRRSSSYDDFPGRALPDPALEGRRLVLVGGEASRWRKRFRFEDFETLGSVVQRGRDRKVFAARYLGRAN